MQKSQHSSFTNPNIPQTSARVCPPWLAMVTSRRVRATGSVAQTMSLSQPSAAPRAWPLTPSLPAARWMHRAQWHVDLRSLPCVGEAGLGGLWVSIRWCLLYCYFIQVLVFLSRGKFGVDELNAFTNRVNFLCQKKGLLCVKYKHSYFPIQIVVESLFVL